MNVNSRVDYFNRLKGNNTYVMADSLDDRKRLVLQAKLYAPAFKQALTRAVEKRDLRKILQDETATFRILDLGCGEGLYFPALVEFLDEQGAKAQIQMVGIDNDTTALATAQDYMDALGLGRKIQLYLHDLRTPLVELEGINLQKSENHFNLIIATAVLMHLSGVEQILKSIHEVLQPGGVFYTRDMRWADGYEYPSVAFTNMDNITRPLIVSRIGHDFAGQHAEYLGEAGFMHLESFEDIYPVGGKTETGRRLLENFLLGTHASRAYMTGRGMISEAEFDKAVAQMFREIEPGLEGHITWINSLAQRPESPAALPNQ